MKKAYSVDKEYWTTNWEALLEQLADKLQAENKQGLIGAEYFEGGQVPITTDQLVDIDSALNMINEAAWEIMGEYGEDYPNLDEEEKAELKELIVAFLDKKDPHGFFHVENVVKKTITTEDLEDAPSEGEDK
jgi:hypothetical protein